MSFVGSGAHRWAVAAILAAAVGWAWMEGAGRRRPSAGPARLATPRSDVPSADGAARGTIRGTVCAAGPGLIVDGPATRSSCPHCRSAPDARGSLRDLSPDGGLSQALL